MAIKELSIKANILWNSIGSMTYMVCQWLTTIFVVRLSTGYDAAGLLSLAMVVTSIFNTFANYKMGTYQISDINRENTMGEYLGFRCFMIIISFFACLVYSLLTCALSAIVTIMLFYVFKAIGLIIDVLHATDQQHRRMDYVGISFIAQGISTLAIFIIVFGLTQSLDFAIIGMTVAVTIILFAYDIPKAAQFEKPRLAFDKGKTIYFLKTSLPAAVAAIATSAIFTIPKQYLAFVSGDAALGIYSSVAAIALVIQWGATYLYSPLLDIFPKLFFEGNTRGFVRLVGKTTLGIIVLTAICAVILEFAGTWVLQLMFGESITPYVYLLQPVLLATAMTAFLWFFSDLLITLRNFRANLIGNVVALGSVLPLTLLCVNIWDMNGVSFASIFACLIGVVFLAFCLFKEVDMQRRAIEPERKRCSDEES